MWNLVLFVLDKLGWIFFIFGLGIFRVCLKKLKFWFLIEILNFCIILVFKEVI